MDQEPDDRRLPLDEGEVGVDRAADAVAVGRCVGDRLLQGRRELVGEAVGDAPWSGPRGRRTRGRRWAWSRRPRRRSRPSRRAGPSRRTARTAASSSRSRFASRACARRRPGRALRPPDVRVRADGGRSGVPRASISVSGHVLPTVTLLPVTVNPRSGTRDGPPILRSGTGEARDDVPAESWRDMPHIRYVTTTDGVRLGYDIQGSGPPLLFVRGWVSDLEEMARSPQMSAYFGALAEHFTVIRYDARTQGVSDNEIDQVDLGAFVLDVEAILEILELDDVILYGQCFGGPIASHVRREPPVPCVEADPRRHVCDAAEDDRRRTSTRSCRRSSGCGRESASLLARADDTAAGGLHRDAPPPRPVSIGSRAGAWRCSTALRPTSDVADSARSVHVPVLVMHRRRSRSIPIDLGRDLAAGLAEARFVPLEGSAHNPWDGDAQAALDAVGDVPGRRVQAARRPSGPSTPVAILFTDMAESTALTSKLGDAGGLRSSSATHDAVVRAAVAENARARGEAHRRRHHGVVPVHLGGARVRDRHPEGLRVAEAPFQVRIGIDAGEPLRRGRRPHRTGRPERAPDRRQGEPGQILVSDVVRKLVAGKTFVFVDRGRHLLKGLPERVTPVRAGMASAAAHRPTREMYLEVQVRRTTGDARSARPARSERGGRRDAG